MTTKVSNVFEAVHDAAVAVDRSFLVGFTGKEWFAACDGIEWQGSTPRQAVQSVIDALHERAGREIADARSKSARAAQVADALTRIGDE